MNTPPSRSIALSLSWSAAEGRRSVSIPLGASLGAAVVLALCAASFELGARTQSRIDRAAEPQSGELRVPPSSLVDSRPIALPAVPAAGGPAGETREVITPLNVRDAAALVMGPSTWQEESKYAKPSR